MDLAKKAQLNSLLDYPGTISVLSWQVTWVMHPKGAEMINAACFRVPLTFPDSIFPSSAWSSWSRPHGVIMLVPAPTYTIHSVNNKVTGLVKRIIEIYIEMKLSFWP